MYTLESIFTFFFLFRDKCIYIISLLARKNLERIHDPCSLSETNFFVRETKYQYEQGNLSKMKRGNLNGRNFQQGSIIALATKQFPLRDFHLRFHPLVLPPR